MTNHCVPFSELDARDVLVRSGVHPDTSDLNAVTADGGWLFNQRPNHDGAFLLGSPNFLVASTGRVSMLLCHDTAAEVMASLHAIDPAG